MWTEAAISSTVTGCAKFVRMKDTASATRCTPDFGCSNLGDPGPDRSAQQANQDLVDHERSEQVGVLRPAHQIQQARHGFDDGVGRASDIQPAIVRRPGDAIREHPCRELCHARGVQVQPEAEKRVSLARSSHLAGDREIDREDEHARGIVFEHFTAQHHDLGALRHDTK